jgi:aerobic-type carbon monoxide dehydrogenase small subunit (CoxS/CutS family)
MTHLGNAKKVVLSRCRLLVNMTNGQNCRTIEGIQKHKKYEIQNIYNEFTQYRLYEIIT